MVARNKVKLAQFYYMVYLNNSWRNVMKTTWRLILALVIALSISACKTTPPVTDTDTDTTTKPAAEVTTAAALDPRDFTDARNFDNPQSLLSKRVIYFDFDKSEVRSEYRPIVAAHAAYVSAHGSARVTLEGHADERGTREYNLGLGERRSNAVSGLLSAAGAMGSQLDSVSYGEERPVCRVSDDSCWSQNRRVEIVYTAR